MHKEQSITIIKHTFPDPTGPTIAISGVFCNII